MLHVQLGGCMSNKLKHPKLWLLRLTLWMLSTCIGTFILCGMRSLRSSFPYMQSFSQLSQQRREDIMRSWSLSYFSLIRMAFNTLKFLILLVFFTQVDV